MSSVFRSAHRQEEITAKRKPRIAQCAQFYFKLASVLEPKSVLHELQRHYR